MNDADGALTKNGKTKSSRNKTIELTDAEKKFFRKSLIAIPERAGRSSDSPLFGSVKDVKSGTYHGDFGDLERILPARSVDLLILDPPYNLAKEFNGRKFAKQDVDEYTQWLDGVISELKSLLKEDASIYICGDWYSSVSIYAAASRHFKVRNRITWEREMELSIKL